MKAKASALVLVTPVCLVATGCGMKVMTKGHVVNAVTGQPVAGAAVAIYWVHKKIGVPGLPTPEDILGTTETLTGARGDFTIPRYLGSRRRHFMGVYKEGYICWSSETTFNPRGKIYEEIFQKRGHSVGGGMVIQLQPMPADIPSEMREQHANFTVDVLLRLWTPGNGPFDEAVRHEEELHRQILRRNDKEK